MNEDVRCSSRNNAVNTADRHVDNANCIFNKNWYVYILVDFHSSFIKDTRHAYLQFFFKLQLQIVFRKSRIYLYETIIVENHQLDHWHISLLSYLLPDYLNI